MARSLQPASSAHQAARERICTTCIHPPSRKAQRAADPMPNAQYLIARNSDGKFNSLEQPLMGMCGNALWPYPWVHHHSVPRGGCKHSLPDNRGLFALAIIRYPLQ